MKKAFLMMALGIGLSASGSNHAKSEQQQENKPVSCHRYLLLYNYSLLKFIYQSNNKQYGN